VKKIKFFDSLETSLEKYIEGLFKEKQCGKIQPVDIAKKLFREMRGGKRISVNSVFVPNNYIIYLNSDDLEAIQPYISSLTFEMLEYVKKKARERKYTLVGSPSVDFQSGEHINIGDIKVSGSYDETNKPVHTAKEKDFIEVKNLRGFMRNNNGRKTGRTEITEDHPENTQKYFFNNSGINSENELACLQIKEGPDKTKFFQLTQDKFVIGRDQDCDIVLSDSSISRRHAVLEKTGKLYVIRDLNSTNGTFINGVKITEKIIQPEDEIKLGTTICYIRMD
jgi:hypothetical protein